MSLAWNTGILREQVSDDQDACLAHHGWPVYWVGFYRRFRTTDLDVMVFKEETMHTRMVALCLALSGLPLLALADSSGARAARYFDVYTNLDNVGLRVALPRSLKWKMATLDRPGADALLLTSPPHFYPVTAMQIQLHDRQAVAVSELEPAALSYANTVRNQLNLPQLDVRRRLEHVKYGEIQGYADVFEKEERGELRSVKSVFGIMPSGAPITLMVSTPVGQLEHIEHTSNKMWSMLQLRESDGPVDNEQPE